MPAASASSLGPRPSRCMWRSAGLDRRRNGVAGEWGAVELRRDIRSECASHGDMPGGPLDPVKGAARYAWAAMQNQSCPGKLSTCRESGLLKSQWSCTEIVANHSPSEMTLSVSLSQRCGRAHVTAPDPVSNHTCACAVQCGLCAD